MRPHATYPAQRRQAKGWLRRKARLYARHSTQDYDELARMLWSIAVDEGLRLDRDEAHDEARKALEDLGVQL